MREKDLLDNYLKSIQENFLQLHHEEYQESLEENY